MCPLCIGTALWVAGSTSAGGIAAAAAVRLAVVLPRPARPGGDEGSAATIDAPQRQPPTKVSP